jgi:hypothetical protein
METDTPHTNLLSNIKLLRRRHDAIANRLEKHATRQQRLDVLLRCHSRSPSHAHTVTKHRLREYASTAATTLTDNALKRALCYEEERGCSSSAAASNVTGIERCGVKSKQSLMPRVRNDTNPVNLQRPSTRRRHTKPHSTAATGVGGAQCLTSCTTSTALSKSKDSWPARMPYTYTSLSNTKHTATCTHTRHRSATLREVSRVAPLPRFHARPRSTRAWRVAPPRWTVCGALRPPATTSARAASRPRRSTRGNGHSVKRSSAVARCAASPGTTRASTTRAFDA